MEPDPTYFDRPPRRVVRTPQPPAPKKSRKAIIALSAIAALLAVIVVILAINLAKKGDDNASATPPESSTSATPTPSATQAADTVCPEGLPAIKYTEERGVNTEYKAALDGTKTVAEFRESLRVEPQFLDYRASNPQLVSVRKALKMEPAELWSKDRDWTELVNDSKTCLNETGYKLLHQMEEMYDLAVANENGKVPAHMCNTGVGPNGTVENDVCGIPEDKQAAIEFAWPGTGQKDYSMHHCGNFGVEKPGTFRQVQFTPPPPHVTTQPPPPPVITTVPPDVCTGPCCGDTCVTTTPPPPPPPPVETETKLPDLAPGCPLGTGSGGPGGCVQGGGDTEGQIDPQQGDPPAVYTPLPEPTATRTQAPVVTATSVAPTTQQTTAAPATEAPQTEEVATPTVDAGTGCTADNPLCG